MIKTNLLKIMTYFEVFLVACLLAGPVTAQEADEAGEANNEAAETETGESSAEGSEDSDPVEDILDADLDEQTYEEDDDDFIPTEEIPADEPIPFPSNI